MIENYLKLIDKDNRNQCIDFYEFLIVNCKESKGSSNNHQNWEGGYFDHILEVFKYADNLYKILSQDRSLNFSLSDALLVLFLHDIEKPIKYSNLSVKYLKDSKLSEDNVKQYFIDRFGFKLTDEHRIALKYIHGEGEDYRKDKRVMNQLCAFCHCCDIISARIFFDYPRQLF